MRHWLICCSLLLVLASQTKVLAEGLQPFTTDGCSSFPDGTLLNRELWLQCCINHDLAYWQGGTYQERLAADRQLAQCVTAVGGPVIGGLMFHGVRVGGSPFWPTHFRWGYGWPYARGYKPLTPAEQEEIRQRLADIKIVPEIGEEDRNP